jgi:imidazole glycerol-phosphate synthase subunit HisH
MNELNSNYDEKAIVIIDYGLGNLNSMFNILKKIGVHAIISADHEIIKEARKLVLPGVGAFDTGIGRLEAQGLISVLNKQVLENHVPILGVCLGMQLLSKRSEEGVLQGLGWIDAETVRFRFDDKYKYLKIPHMGWNTVRVCKETSLFTDIEQNPRFYFVHSYHVVCETEADILSRTEYGYEFVSAFVHDNITGVQFHPEKSHKFGMNFLKNWALS